MNRQRPNSAVLAAVTIIPLVLTALATLASNKEPMTRAGTDEVESAATPSGPTAPKAQKPAARAAISNPEAAPASLSLPREKSQLQQQRAGNAYPKLLPAVSGAVAYQGTDVRYLFLQLQGVPRIGFVPPVDIARDDSGQIKVYLQDPKTLGDFALQQPDHTWKLVGARELAQAVATRQVDPDTPVFVSIEFVLHNEASLREELFLGVMDQIQHEARQKPSEHWLAKMNTAEARRKVMMLPAREFRVRCATEGLEDVTFVWDKYPTLGGVAHMKTRKPVPARFLADLFSSAGSDLVAEDRYDGFDEQFTRLLAEDFVAELIEKFLKEAGKGEHLLNEQDAKLLLTRDKVQNLQRNSTWVRGLILYGNNPDLMNTLFTYFQSINLDMFAASEQQVSEYLKESLDWIKVQENPSYLDLFRKVDANEALTMSDYQTAHSLINAVSKARGGSAGFFALLGKVPVGANGEMLKFDQKAVARSDEMKQAYQNATSTLGAVHKGGHIEIPKTLDLLLIDTKALRRSLTTRLEAVLTDEVHTLAVSSPFNSARRTLNAQLVSNLPPNREIENAIPRLAPPPKPETTPNPPMPKPDPPAPTPPEQAVQIRAVESEIRVKEPNGNRYEWRTDPNTGRGYWARVYDPRLGQYGGSSPTVRDHRYESGNQPATRIRDHRYESGNQPATRIRDHRKKK